MKMFPPLTLQIDGLTPGVGLLRYTHQADTCNYTLWFGDKVESRYMLEAHRPPWLEVIVNAAKLGGHTHSTAWPPPTTYVWCEVDVSRNLVRFVDRSKPHVS